MNKVNNNRGAAGLRRSAIAERIRLKEEWSELKETEASKTRPLIKKPMNARPTPAVSAKKKGQKTIASSAKKTEPSRTATDVLYGVVALVEVGEESRALPLRAALAALGATVAASWSPLVTHLVWTDGGSRQTRAKARALGCKLVSPLWVEACAASATKLNERTFPTASRQSDLPSPRTLRQLLKRADAENIPLTDLLSDSKDSEGKTKLRISTDTEQDTSADTSNETIDVESRINTAPRRALPPSTSAASVERPTKSRRKLFTQKEAEVLDKTSGDESDGKTVPSRQKRVRIQHRITERDKKDLARAERMAKRILHACTMQNSTKSLTQAATQPRIVLTGMSRTERHAVTQAIQSLNGRIQNHVNKRTTHVLLGSCRPDAENTRIEPTNHRSDITGVTSIYDLTCNNRCDIAKKNNVTSGVNNCYVNNVASGVNNCFVNNDISISGVTNTGFVNIGMDKKARTLNALLGAARGCRVLHARWAIDGAVAKKWLHQHGYEVYHLRKICQKARVERTALGRQQSEYAFDVFNGMRIRIKSDAEQKDGAIQLLKLCGAYVQDGEQTQNGGRTQNGGFTQNGRRIQDGGSDCDIVIGCGVNEVASKWVFDSVAAGRMRTTRRYVNSANNAGMSDRL